MKTYVHPQETWNAKECDKRARYAPADSFGNKPPKGIVAGSASTHPQYGQTIRYNGGTIIDGEHYDAVSRPLPVIPQEFEFVPLSGWGTVIRRKN